MTKRTLSLKRETLTDLTTDDLTTVIGAAAASGPTCPLNDCSDIISRVVRCDLSLNCPTLIC